MKYLVTLPVAVLCLISAAFAFEPKAEYIKGLTYYMPDNMGIYRLTTDTMVDRYPDNVDKWSIIAYNKKMRQLYVKTPFSICMIGVDKKSDDVLKRNKDILQFKNEKDILPLVRIYTEKLESEINDYNRRRELFIADSINELEARLRIERERQIEDSIRHIAEIEEYRKNNKPKQFHLNNTNPCALCAKSLRDNVVVMGVLSDTVVIGINKVLPEISFVGNCCELHALPLPELLKNEPGFQLHYEAFRDSLTKESNFYNIEKWRQNGVSNEVASINELFEQDAFNKAVKIAPYGFIDTWGWNDQYGMVTFYASYINLSKKVIKYIQFHFSIYNDVNDLRCSGTFNGTGPVQSMHGGSWDWDTSQYFVAGDASSMTIKKIVITYMDGTKKTLSENQIVYN